MKSVISILLLLHAAFASAAQPVLGENTAAAVIDRGLQAEPLMWLPFPLPYEIEQSSSSKDAKLLSALFDHGLVTREKQMRMEDMPDSAQTRKKLLLLWRYDYPQAQNAETPEGFYYGHGRLKHIVELSSPYLIGSYYYAEAYIQWYVDDMQDWITDPAFRIARTLRRSAESYSRPFEKRVYLQFDGNHWALWKGQPGML